MPGRWAVLEQMNGGIAVATNETFDESRGSNRATTFLSLNVFLHMTRRYLYESAGNAFRLRRFLKSVCLRQRTAELRHELGLRELNCLDRKISQLGFARNKNGSLDPSRNSCRCLRRV